MIGPAVLRASLQLAGSGRPIDPVLVIDLDEFARADRLSISSAIGALCGTRHVAVGVANRPVPETVMPLAEALTFSFVATDSDGSPERSLVPTPNLPASLAQLRQSVARSPQASVALALLLRQTEQLDPELALGAEASIYSMLLGGSEFRRWLELRGNPRTAEQRDLPRLLVGRVGDELAVVLNRPERHNALDAGMREQLYEALSVATLDPSIRRVVLSGSGPSFCAGGDLDEFGTAVDAASAFFVRLEGAPWRLLEQIRHRVEARVHGATIGAGLELAAFAGHVTAAPETVFRLPETAMGLVPGAGGTVSIPRRIGRWRAAWLMLTGASLDAETAQRWGLVDRIRGRE